VRLAAACLLLALAAPAAAQSSYVERPEVQAFIGELVQKHGFVRGELKRLFSRVQRVDPTLQLILPAERASWEDFRAQFLNEARIANGLAFWKANRRTLARAERDYGVPASIILGILGVETNYGRNMGRYRVVDALTTLAFDYPPRASFFRGELEQYLLLAREDGVDVFSQRGSYAGAIGIPQFMPTSLRRYAVDFNHDGKIDLTRSPSDAIGSVANFLKEHGWRRGEPVLLRAKPSPEALARYVDGTVEPKDRLADLVAAGLELDPAPPSTDALGVLVALGAEYRVGLQNFYVITRYNRSALYAAAVSDLADALSARAQSAGR
jgi:peptidoglycan lytic transglycosylase B